MSSLLGAAAFSPSFNPSLRAVPVPDSSNSIFRSSQGRGTMARISKEKDQCLQEGKAVPHAGPGRSGISFYGKNSKYQQKDEKIIV